MSKKINKFSIPLPAVDNWKERIDDVIKLNEELTNSKIVSFYGCCNDPNWLCGFESLRSSISQIKERKLGKIIKMEEYLKIINYAKQNNFDFIYLLNSPFNIMTNELNNETIENFTNKVSKLLDLFNKNDIFNIRVSNINLINLIYKTYNTIFNIYLSTNNEYPSLLSYSRLVERFKNIKQICFSNLVNKDFTFLQNFRKKYPYIETEILANEGCLLDCPYRREHSMHLGELPYITQNTDIKYSISTNNATLSICGEHDFAKNIYEAFLSRQVYPWDISEYDGLIDMFKLSGREHVELDSEYKKFLSKIELYLIAIENFKLVENYNYTQIFNSKCFLNPYINNATLGEIKDFLPKIEFFKNKKESCLNTCGSSCTYCYQLADKFKEYYNKYIL